MSDFSDTPFVAGSLFGLRAFAVDRTGRLHGPSYNQVFRPDENVAECRKGEGTLTWGGIKLSATSFTYNYTSVYDEYEKSMARLRAKLDELEPPQTKKKRWGRGKEAAKAVVPPPPEPEPVKAIEPPKPPPHKVGQQYCTCGFYAYFDGGNDYKQDDRVTAIIEGYGRATVGTRGFRAEKAKLTALVIKPSRRDQFSLVLRNYPDVPVYDRLSEALAAHPLSDLLPSPADEDFWTRPIR